MAPGVWRRTNIPSQLQGLAVQSDKPRPFPQKTIGVLGGMSNQAAGEYYRLLNEKLNARLGGWDNGEIIIVSVNFGNIEAFVRNGRWHEAHAYLTEKVDRLERAGVDLVMCVSNTMHRLIEPIMADRPNPFIHIADPIGRAMRAAGMSRVGLLGTSPVMRSPELRRRYREEFGVEIVAPTQADMEVVDRIIFDELVRGELRADSKWEYLRVVGELLESGAEGVILGCTEIFLLIAQEDLPGFPVFNTNRATRPGSGRLYP